MAATTVERDTKQMGKDAGGPTFITFPLAASVKLIQGTFAMANASGQATPGATATGQTALGRVELTVDNTGGAAAALFADIRQGTFKWNNSTAGDAITQADFGKTCFIVDNQTVAKTDGTGTRSIAGRIVKVDTDGVWVKTVMPGA